MITLTSYINKAHAEKLLSAVFEHQLNGIAPSNERFVVNVAINPEPVVATNVMTEAANTELSGLLDRSNWSDASKKIHVIRELRRLIPGLGLDNAKYIVEGGKR